MSDQIRKAFEATFQRDWEDPNQAGDRHVFTLGYEAALATQPQAPQGAVTPKVSVFQYARCNNTLRLLAKPYPRTCAECGLGPCKTRSVAAPETPEGKK